MINTDEDRTIRMDAETVAALDALVPTGVGEIQWTSDQD